MFYKEFQNVYFKEPGRITNYYSVGLDPMSLKVRINIDAVKFIWMISEALFNTRLFISYNGKSLKGFKSSICRLWDMYSGPILRIADKIME
jgi:hypothetical protein